MDLIEFMPRDVIFSDSGAKVRKILLIKSETYYFLA
jgi:hypothetical protein